MIRHILQITSLLLKRSKAGFILGATVLEKMKAGFGLPLISFFPEFSFVMKKFGREKQVYFRSGSDVAMWIEIFMDNEYGTTQDYYPKRVIDLGANVGFASLYLHLRDPKVEIVAVEPDPHNFSLLQKNLKDCPTIQLFQIAIATSIGEQSFYSLPNQGMSSSLIKNDKAEEVKVKTLTLASLVQEIGWNEVDLIKFDIEGTEWNIFESGVSVPCGRLIGEYHEDIIGKPVNDFINLFVGYTSQVRKLFSKRYIVILTATEK